MRWPPSKDHRDYQTRGRWEGRGPPRWLTRLGRDPRTPYRYVLAAAVVGLGLGAAIGAIVGWNPLWTAIVVGLIGQLGLNVWWWRRARR
jgi:hypothetical protein